MRLFTTQPVWLGYGAPPLRGYGPGFRPEYTQSYQFIFEEGNPVYPPNQYPPLKFMITDQRIQHSNLRMIPPEGDVWCIFFYEYTKVFNVCTLKTPPGKLVLKDTIINLQQNYFIYFIYWRATSFRQCTLTVFSHSILCVNKWRNKV